MRGAVIAQVEAHHFESGGEQALRQRQQVGGVRAAFPAVQQHGELAPGFAPALRRAGMKRLQRDAITAVEQQFLARRQQGHGAALHARRVAAAGRPGWSGSAGCAASAEVEKSGRAESRSLRPAAGGRARGRRGSDRRRHGAARRRAGRDRGAASSTVAAAAAASAGESASRHQAPRPGSRHPRPAPQPGGRTNYLRARAQGFDFGIGGGEIGAQRGDFGALLPPQPGHRAPRPQVASRASDQPADRRPGAPLRHQGRHVERRRGRLRRQQRRQVTLQAFGLRLQRRAEEAAQRGDFLLQRLRRARRGFRATSAAAAARCPRPRRSARLARRGGTSHRRAAG